MTGSMRGMRARFWPTAFVAFGALVASSAHALGWPDGSIEQRLGSPSVLARREAARELLKLSPSTAATLALRALADRDVEVRLAAADALLAAGRDVMPAASGPTDPAAAPGLASWFTDADPRIRERACRLAGQSGDATLLASLVRALGDSDLSVRVAAARGLGYATPTPDNTATDPVPALMARVEDQAVEMRLAALGSLGQLGDARAIAAIAGRARDQEASVRRAAATALGRFRDPRAAAALEPLLADAAQDVQLVALTSLSQLGMQGRATLLLPLLTGLRESQRRAALNALGRAASDAEAGRIVLRGAEVVLARDPQSELGPWRDGLTPHVSVLQGELQSALRGPRPLADLAAAALGRASAPPAGLACELAQLVARRRLDEATALVALGHVTGATAAAEHCALPPLLEHLGHGKESVRAAARTGLRAYLEARPQGDSRAALPLRDALQRRGSAVTGQASPRGAALDEPARRELLELLGMTRSAAAEPPLTLELASAPQPALRAAAARALGSIPRGALGERALVGALADRSPDVRRGAALALGERGTATALPLLEAAWKSAKTDGGLDTPLALYAYGRTLGRAPSGHAFSWFEARRDEAMPEERDLVIALLARARLGQRAASAPRDALGTRWNDASADDRRAVLRGLSGLAAAAPIALEALADADLSVRAEAAALLASLAGALGENELRRLVLAARGQDELAVDASAALARRASAARELCPLLKHGRAEVRSNALLGLARLRTSCADGSAVRELLARDASALVRRSAARVLASSTRATDLDALARCSDEDRDARVADACAARTVIPARRESDAILVQFARTGERPKALAPFVLEYPDEILRAGLTDRQGALFDPAAPRGILRLADHGRSRK